jgi:hypothetical protein
VNQFNSTTHAAANDRLVFTTARWCNRRKDDGRWSKVLAHTGPYTQFRYATDTADPGYFRHRWQDGTDGPLQLAIICSRWSGVFAIDVDNPFAWAGSATAQLLSHADAFTVRGSGFHILVDARHLREMFPVQGATVWGDLKAHGFVPVPGSWHYSGMPYAPTGRPVVRATPGLIEAAMADRAEADETARATLAWLEAEGVIPRSNGGNGRTRTGPYDHDTARAGIVLKGLLDRKPLEVIRAEWDAAPDHGPLCKSSKGFTDADFQRHLRTGLRTAEKRRAEQARQAQMQAMIWAMRTGGAR